MTYIGISSGLGSVLFCLSYLIGEGGGRKYCYPSQEKICLLLEHFYNLPRSRRTLNRWLKQLEEDGYIKRVRRIRRNKHGEMEFQTTAYYVLKRGLGYLRKVGTVLKKMGKAFRLSGKQSRCQTVPSASQILDRRSSPGTKDGLSRLKDILGPLKEW